MFFIDQLKAADNETLIATLCNATRIAQESAPQGDMASRVRVATALKVIEDCKNILKERINEL